MINPIASLLRRIEELERRVANMVRMGTVLDYDAKQDKVRLEDGSGWETDWLPHQSGRHGAVKQRTTPSKGEQMLVVSPSGENEQGVALPGFWTGQNGQPSTEEGEDKTTIGDTSLTHREGFLEQKMGGDAITWTPGKWELSIGGAVIKIEGGKVSIEADEITLKAAAIITDGATHLDDPGKAAPEVLTVAGKAKRVHATI